MENYMVQKLKMKKENNKQIKAKQRQLKPSKYLSSLQEPILSYLCANWNQALQSVSCREMHACLPFHPFIGVPQSICWSGLV